MTLETLILDIPNRRAHARMPFEVLKYNFIISLSVTIINTFTNLYKQITKKKHYLYNF